MQWVTANAVGHLPFYDVDLRVLYGFGLLPAANFQFPYVVRNTLTLPESHTPRIYVVVVQ